MASFSPSLLAGEGPQTPSNFQVGGSEHQITALWKSQTRRDAALSGGCGPPIERRRKYLELGFLVLDRCGLRERRRGLLLLLAFSSLGPPPQSPFRAVRVMLIWCFESFVAGGQISTPRTNGGTLIVISLVCLFGSCLAAARRLRFPRSRYRRSHALSSMPAFCCLRRRRPKPATCTVGCEANPYH